MCFFFRIDTQTWNAVSHNPNGPGLSSQYSHQQAKARAAAAREQQIRRHKTVNYIMYTRSIPIYYCIIEYRGHDNNIVNLWWRYIRVPTSTRSIRSIFESELFLCQCVYKRCREHGTSTSGCVFLICLITCMRAQWYTSSDRKRVFLIFRVISCV